MKKKVLFFINSEVGGAERMSVLISKMLINKGLDVKYVIIKDKINDTSIVDFLPTKREVIYVESKNHADKIKQFYCAIKAVCPNVVFSSHYSINDKVLLLKPIFREIRFVIRSDNYYYTFSKLERMIIWLTYKMSDAMIAQTLEMKEEFERNRILPANKIFALDNPVDRESIDKKLKGTTSPYPKDGKKHIVAVGRFAYQKGFDLLVKAFGFLLKNHKNCDLYIVGSYTEKWKSEYDRIKLLIDEMNIGDYVHCVGYQDNPYRYIKFADCFVLSSRWEGLPNVLVEALYLKIPVAAFKCIPIIERMVRDGLDGYLAEKEDVKGLSVAIEKSLLLEGTNPIYCGASDEDYVKLF